MPVLLTSNTAGGTGNTFWGNTARTSQSFTIPSGYTRLQYIDLLIYRSGFSSGVAYLDIYNVSGDTPTGSVLTSIGVSGSSIPTSSGWVRFDFADINVSAGSKYACVLRLSGSTSTSNSVYWVLSTNVYSGGVALRSTDSGSTWIPVLSSQSTDWNFRAYGSGVPGGMGATALSGVTSTSVNAASSVSDARGSTITSRGFVWSYTNSGPVLSNSPSKQVGSGTGSFSTTVTGLEKGRLVYMRSYATNSIGTSYGTVNTFSTLSEPPSVSTQAVTSIDKFSATFNGNVVSDNGAAISQRGFVWGTSSNPTLSNSNAQVSGTTGVFTYSGATLVANTTYYVRAYAVNTQGTTYGGQVSFTTLVAEPEVSIDAPSNILTTAVDFSGEVTTDGGSPVTERGFVWGFVANPTLTSNKITKGSGEGVFTHTLTGLQPGTTYHVRAYAINTFGTAYSDNETFTTRPTNVTTAIAQVMDRDRINLVWNLPAGATTVMVRRKTGSYPTDEADGDLVYNGANTSFSDTGLSFGTTHYYRFWGVRSGSYSITPAEVSATTKYGLTNPANAYASDSVYATAPANDNIVLVKLSNNGGTSWGSELSKQLPGSNGTVTMGIGSEERWGLSWVGEDVKNTNLRLMITLGSNKGAYHIFKSFGFDIADAQPLTGIEVVVEGYHSSGASYIDNIRLKVHYGDTTIPVRAGSLAYNTTAETVSFYDGTEWKNLAVAT